MKNLKHILSFSVIIVFITLFIASASASAVYTPPAQNNSEKQFSKIINKPYDEVWDNLINYAASTYFGIENFEKESGLLTLSFGASNPEEYITGGYLKVDIKNINESRHFEGDFVKYHALYNSVSLIGKMQIVVKKKNEIATQVIVNAKYVFTINQKILTNSGSNLYYAYVPETWSFNSGNCGETIMAFPEDGTAPNRIICPTYKAENAILNALK